MKSRKCWNRRTVVPKRPTGGPQGSPGPTKEAQSDLSEASGITRRRKKRLRNNRTRLEWKNSMKNQDYEKNEGLNPASAYKFPEAYCESRKKVSTVTHFSQLDVENSMKIKDFWGQCPKTKWKIKIINKMRAWIRRLHTNFLKPTAKVEKTCRQLHTRNGNLD